MVKKIAYIAVNIFRQLPSKYFLFFFNLQKTLKFYCHILIIRYIFLFMGTVYFLIHLFMCLVIQICLSLFKDASKINT